MTRRVSQVDKDFKVMMPVAVRVSLLSRFNAHLEKINTTRTKMIDELLEKYLASVEGKTK